jgi:hypothetical protein
LLLGQEINALRKDRSGAPIPVFLAQAYHDESLARDFMVWN